jgi:cell division protein FtsL
MSEPVFLLALAMAAITIIVGVKAIAGAISGHMSRSAFAQLREQLDQQATALEDAQNSIASQATELAELQERVDFTERLLAQNRDRIALPGERRE